MKFFGREIEIAELQRIRELSRKCARFTVVTGRRRVGKTELIKHALNDGSDIFIYLLITRQSERTLCEGLQREIEATGLAVLGQASKFIDLVKIVATEAKVRPITLVIDEFQEFERINPTVFGELQGLWDDIQHKAKLNLLVCGSVNRLMNKIFFQKAEPLYGRNTGHLRLAPFGPSLLKKILKSEAGRLIHTDLWSLWTMTGGVARYVQLFMDDHAYTRRAMIESVLAPSSPFIDEGKIILAEEFGAEYSTFFSILSEIASGKNTFGDLSNSIGTDVGSYLARLESDYGIISRIVPIFDKERSRNSHYSIEDCFLRFWFRFIFKYRSWIEFNRIDALKKVIERDFNAFAGFSLERYFKQKFMECTSYTRIGGWWDRKGENELDLVCENEIDGDIDIYEVKADPSRLNLACVREKCAAFLKKNPSIAARVKRIDGLSLKDM